MIVMCIMAESLQSLQTCCITSLHRSSCWWQAAHFLAIARSASFLFQVSILVSLCLLALSYKQRERDVQLVMLLGHAGHQPSNNAWHGRRCDRSTHAVTRCWVVFICA